MATFTMTIYSTVKIVDKPRVLPNSFLDTPCVMEVTVSVPVPPGESRYVEVSHNGVMYFEDDITETTEFRLALDEGIVSTTKSSNTIREASIINVKLTEFTDIYYSHQISRYHSGVPC